MDTHSFTEAFPKQIDDLCLDIRRVYHLSSIDALQQLKSTHFYKYLSQETSGLWKQDSKVLFSIYQDEIEYGKRFQLS